MGRGVRTTRSGRAVSVGLGAALAAVLLWWSVRGIEWREVGRAVAHADPVRLVLGAALAAFALFLRACRWRLLLNAGGTVSIVSAFGATAAGYFGNNFLPARAGELIRTFMISSRSPLPNAFVLSTALADRFADAIALLVVSAVVMLTLHGAPGWLGTAARPLAIAGLLGILCIAILPLLGDWGRLAIARIPLPPAVRERLTVHMDQALLGIAAFHHRSRLSGFVALTAVVWSIDALGAVIAAAALGLHLTAGAAFLLISALGLASALPSTPGYLGVYQFVAVTVLGPFGFSRTDAIAFILVVQALAYVVIAISGGIGFVRYRRDAAVARP